VLEEATKLNDFELVLSKVPIVHNETLLLEPGPVQPKGFIDVHVHLHHGAPADVRDDPAVAQLAAALSKIWVSTPEVGARRRRRPSSLFPLPFTGLMVVSSLLC
jgi:hypothetical protein